MHHHLHHLFGLPLGSFFTWVVLLIPAILVGLAAGKSWGDRVRVAITVTLLVWALCWAALRWL